MNIFTPDDIDFSLYESETDAKQKVKPAALWVQSLIDNLKNPVQVIRAVMPWRKTHGQINFRPGEVTIWGGANGQGKSLITGQVAMGFMAQGDRCCIASFEMKPVRTIERMIRQWSGQNPNDEFIHQVPSAKAALIDAYEQFQVWTANRLWIYDQQGTVDTKQVCAVVRYAVKELHINHFFIDSLMKCVAGEDDYNGQKLFIDQLTAIARDNAIHIHVIHHIKKPADENYKPNKYDYKGSGAIVDQVDNVITVWRNKKKERDLAAGKPQAESEPDSLLICDKQRNGDWEGNIGLWFDRQSTQFIAGAGEEPYIIYQHPETGVTH